MASRRTGVVKRRKTQMFLHSVIPVIKTHDEVIKEKLETGKFLFTVTGIIKICGNLTLLIAVAIFLSTSICEDTPDWFPYLFPISVGLTILVSFSLYFIFSLGLTVKDPGWWVRVDIISNMCFAVLIIIAAAMSMNSCNSDKTVHKTPEPVALCGAGILIISCGSLFLLYRYREDEDDPQYHTVTARPPPQDPRKSVFA